jgi:hypothetical protein
MFKTVLVCDHCGTEKVTVPDTGYGYPLGFYGSYYRDTDKAYDAGWRVRKYWREGEHRTVEKNVRREYDNRDWRTGEVKHVVYHTDVQDPGNILHLCPACVALVDTPEPKKARKLSQKQLLAELVAISPLTTKNAGLYNPVQCRYCGMTQGTLEHGYGNVPITIDLDKTKHAETCIWKIAKDKVSNNA